MIEATVDPATSFDPIRTIRKNLNLCRKRAEIGDAKYWRISRPGFAANQAYLRLIDCPVATKRANLDERYCSGKH
jgi:hypothetical protein